MKKTLKGYLLGFLSAAILVGGAAYAAGTTTLYDVIANGIKIVVKNNKPACILLSPEQYETLMEMLSDNILCEEAEKRMASSQKTYTHAEVMRELGITEDMLAAADVEVDEA